MFTRARPVSVIVLLSAVSLAACTPPGQNAQDASPTTAMGPGTLNVADAAISGGDPSMALSLTQGVLANDPDNVDALVHEGDAYYALQRCPAAQAAFQTALKYDAKNAPAETGLGRCLLKTDPAAAEQALMAAVQDDPGNADAWNDLGIARDLQGNFANAVDPYEKALAAKPGLTAAEVNLGLSLALAGHGPEAMQYLGPLAAGPGATPKIRENYAAALIASGRDDEARQVLLVDLTPDQAQRAMDGFAAVIAASIQAPPPPPPPAPTVPQVTTAPVSVAPQAQPVPLAPAAVAAPVAVPAPSGGDPNAAYSGPSPIQGAVSSSTPGPVATPPVPQPAPEKVADVAPAPQPAPEASQAPVAAPAKGAAVQLGALNSQDDAQAAWNKAYGAAPALFTGKSPDIVKADVNGKVFYRLRVGGFASSTDAAKFCGEVSASGTTCAVANF